jgi:hypothetical protein
VLVSLSTYLDNKMSVVFLSTGPPTGKLTILNPHLRLNVTDART